MDIVWLIAGIAGTIGLVYLGLWAAKLLKQNALDDQPAPSAGFTLADLRQLHKAGKLSQEEFERLKSKAIAVALKQEKPKKPQ